MTRLGLIRHGITEWNRERRAQGQSNIPLNDIGRWQARLLAERLRAGGWDCIYSSDLSRAQETAELVGTVLGLTVVTDERLREMHKGETEGTTLEERIARWGQDWIELELGIESRESITARGISIISEILHHHKGQNVLIFSHGALISYTVKALIPEQNIDQHMHNTAVTIIKHNDGCGSKWACELFNCAGHLSDQAVE